MHDVEVRETRKESLPEDQGLENLGNPVCDADSDHACLDALAGNRVMVQAWQNRPRPWDYDDPEEYRTDLNAFMEKVIWDSIR